MRLVYDLGSDDRQFQALIEELERRQVRLGWDAVILIGEWDSFYGRALPLEFRAAACAKVATFPEADLKQIQVPADIKRWCATIPQAVDLQIHRPADYEANPRLVGFGALMLMGSFAAFVAFGGASAVLANHDEGEPFSWTAGVSIWPSELLRLLVVMLCLVFLAKGSQDLRKNSEDITREFQFQDGSGRQRFSFVDFWTNLKRVYHPAATMTATTVDQAWAWYREAGKASQWAARTMLLFVLYLGMMWGLGYFVLDEEYIHPCRGWFSCRVDWFMTLSSAALVVLLNLAVFDAVMLCRRWIGWVTASTGGWSDQVQEEYLRDYGLGQAKKTEFEKLKYLAVIDLIGQRTDVVNRLIRYPFIALLIMIAGRNDYFDIWNYPLLLLFTWR